MATILIALQILKVFLDLWRENNQDKAKTKANTAKEIVDAFATADPKDKASKLNAVINDIRLRNK